ncbi:hypothetical protein ACHAXN_006760 [Cyclotella atomus]
MSSGKRRNGLSPDGPSRLPHHITLRSHRNKRYTSRNQSNLQLATNKSLQQVLSYLLQTRHLPISSYELAHVKNPPQHLFVYCDSSSETGGETALIDSTWVFDIQGLREHIHPIFSKLVAAAGLREVQPKGYQYFGQVGERAVKWGAKSLNLSIRHRTL